MAEIHGEIKLLMTYQSRRVQLAAHNLRFIVASAPQGIERFCQCQPFCRGKMDGLLLKLERERVDAITRLRSWQDMLLIAEGQAQHTRLFPGDMMTKPIV